MKHILEEIDNNIIKKNISSADSGTATGGTSIKYRQEQINDCVVSNEIKTESFVADTNRYKPLEGAFLFEGTEKVTDSNGTTYIKDRDYEIDYLDGKIKATKYGDLENFTEYTIEYAYADPFVTTLVMNASSYKVAPIEVLKYSNGRESLLKTLLDFSEAENFSVFPNASSDFIRFDNELILEDHSSQEIQNDDEYTNDRMNIFKTTINLDQFSSLNEINFTKN